MYLVIPTHNRLSLLKRTIDSFTLIEKPKTFKKLIIIENGGKFGVESLVKKYDSDYIKYYYHSVGNKSQALNTYLFTLAKNTFIIFCDDDVRFSEKYLVKYDDEISKYSYEDKIYIGGPFKVDYEVKPSGLYSDFLPSSAKGATNEFFLKQDNYWFPGINWGCFNNAVLSQGGFCSTLGPGAVSGARGQESEFQMRLYRSGYKAIFIESNYVYHYVPKNRSSFFWALKRMYASGLGNGHIQFKTNTYVDVKDLQNSVLKRYTKVLINILWGIFYKDKINIAIADLFMTTFDFGKLIGIKKALRSTSNH